MFTTWTTAPHTLPSVFEASTTVPYTLISQSGFYLSALKEVVSLVYYLPWAGPTTGIVSHASRCGDKQRLLYCSCTGASTMYRAKKNSNLVAAIHGHVDVA